jgi:hypothetical protein
MNIPYTFPGDPFKKPFPRQIALIVDLTSLRLPIAPFLQSHQAQRGKMATLGEVFVD